MLTSRLALHQALPPPPSPTRLAGLYFALAGSARVRTGFLLPPTPTVIADMDQELQGKARQLIERILHLRDSL